MSDDSEIDGTTGLPTGSGALRIPVPQSRAYQTSLGEQTVLHGINPDTIGAMYGLLLNQRAIGQSQQDEYTSAIDAAGRRQQRVAGLKLANDSAVQDSKTAVELAKLGLPMGTALSMIGSRRLPGYQTRQQDIEGVQHGDSNRDLALSAEALQKAGAGSRDAAEAGFRVDPGQVVRGPGGVLGAQMTTGTPLSLDKEALANRGRVGAAQGPKAKFILNDAGGTSNIEVTSSNPDEAYNISRSLRARLEADRDARTTDNRGTLGANGQPLPTTPRPAAAAQSVPAATPQAQQAATQPRPRVNTAPLGGGPATDSERAYARSIKSEIGDFRSIRRTPTGTTFIGTRASKTVQNP